MTTRGPTILEVFVAQFNELKKLANNDPQRLNDLWACQVQAKSSIERLFMFMHVNNFEQRVFHSSHKFHIQSPIGFEDLYSDYKKRWESKILECTFGVVDLSSLSDLIPADSETDEGDPDFAVYAPDPELDEYFDPLTHDGGKAVSLVLWAAESKANNVGSQHADVIDYASKIGLEAFEYLTETIGLDVDGVFRRWRNVPVTFIPSHVSNLHGLAERGSLYDLIDDAVRAYVFGSPVAAIATCRMVLETVLKQHYGLDYQFVDKKGRTRDKGLGELVILADREYEFIQGGRLKMLTDRANKIIHNYTRREAITAEDERAIANFLKTLKFMIERAPKPS